MGEGENTFGVHAIYNIPYTLYPIPYTLYPVPYTPYSFHAQKKKTWLPLGRVASLPGAAARSSHVCPPSPAQENTFYSKRTHSIVGEHARSSDVCPLSPAQENTFYSKRTHSIVREHIPSPALHVRYMCSLYTCLTGLL